MRRRGHRGETLRVSDQGNRGRRKNERERTGADAREIESVDDICMLRALLGTFSVAFGPLDCSGSLEDRVLRMGTVINRRWMARRSSTMYEYINMVVLL